MTNGVHLVGGGRDPAAAAQLYGPFLDEAGPNPSVALVVMDEGDGQEQFDIWAATLTAVRDCRPFAVLMPFGAMLDVAELREADGLFVAGGLTPAYAAALTPVAETLRSWLADRPYCGFSAGAVVAADNAVAGGWLLDGRPLIPDDAGEDLAEITVVGGLGLVSLLVDVHAGQWGTLPRLLAVVAGSGITGVAIDENTAVRVIGGIVTVAGAGHVHLAAPGPDGEGVLVRRLSAGAEFSVSG